MGNKVLTNEEKRLRLKSELEKAKIRVKKEDTNCRNKEIELNKIRKNLFELNHSKYKYENKVINIIDVLLILLAIGSTIFISFCIPTLLMIYYKINFLTYLMLEFGLFGISKILIVDNICFKLGPKLEKSAINKLVKHKKYKNLLENIKKHELEEKNTVEVMHKAISNYYMALDARAGLEHKIFNFYNNNQNYSYKYNSSIQGYVKDKPLSSKKIKKKEKKEGK